MLIGLFYLFKTFYGNETYFENKKEIAFFSFF